jgi:cobalt-zinc-cadmium efflux system protein
VTLDRRAGHRPGESVHPHAHAHAHAHDHAHAHAVSVSGDSERRVFLVMLLTAGYMVVQVVGGMASGSLALLADAGHMLSDAAALGLAWGAFRMARRPPTAAKSFGWHRIEVLAAFVNGLALFAIAGWIVVEAGQRLAAPAPAPVAGPVMLIVAAVGFAVNLAGFAILHRGSHDNVNLRGALLHVLGDLLGSVAAMVAAVVIIATGWTPIDPLLSVFVALLILRSAWSLIGRTGHILLEGAPPHLTREDLMAALGSEIAAVRDVHHVHLWSLTAERTLVTLHVTVDDACDRDAVLDGVHATLARTFGITHATVQVEGEALAARHCSERLGRRGEGR